MKRVVRMALGMVLWAILAARADEMTLGDRTVKGVFTGFGKGQFRFQTWAGQTLAERAMDVRKLVLDQPVAVRLETRSRKEAEAVQLKGYDSGQFRIVRDGRDAVERESQVRGVTVQQSEQSFGEYMQRAQQAEAEEAEEAITQVPERLEELLEMGKVNVVHFHQPASITSTRQGSYCQRLAKDSRGRVVYKRLVLDSPGAPAMLRFGLKTLPQFWFYSHGGKLVTKLTERFTPADFEEALEAAKRGTSRESAE